MAQHDPERGVLGAAKKLGDSIESAQQDKIDHTQDPGPGGGRPMPRVQGRPTSTAN